MHDHRKILANPRELIRDVSDKSMTLEGLSGKDALAIVHGLCDELWR
jgi:hypothetical protein